jgi:hypothetical protein
MKEKIMISIIFEGKIAAEPYWDLRRVLMRDAS